MPKIELGRWIPPAGFVLALLVAAGARWLEAGAPVRSLLAAPLYYLIPTGLGLAVLGGARRTSAERGACGTLVSYFVGVVVLASVLVARERYFSQRLALDATLLAVVGVSALGFAGARWPVGRNSETRSVLGDLLIVLPVFLLAYAMRFGIFSEYPRTDLFQATHILKAALEMAYFDRLNPFTADSYLPVIPSSLGLLVRLFGATALDSVWFIALLSFVLKFFVLREAARPLLETRAQRLLAMSVGMCFLSAGMPSNGGLAALGSILLFGMQMAKARQGLESSLSSSAAVLLGFGAGYVLMHSHPAFLSLALLLLLAAYRLPQLGALATGAIGPAVLAFALTPIHRSTIVFLPLALLLPLAIEGLHRLPLRALIGTAVTITALLGAFAAAILYLSLKLPADPLHAMTLYDTLLRTLLGVQLGANPDLLTGTGPKVALFEIARAMSPSFLLATCVLLLLTYATFRNSGMGPALVDLAPVKRALGAWVVAVLLGGVLLLGLPFAYRAAFYVWLVLAVVLSPLVLPSATSARCTSIVAATLLLCSLYFSLALPLAYECTLLAPCPDQPYLDRARPLIAPLATLILAAAIAQATRALLGRTTSNTSLAAALVGLFAIEFCVSQAYFMPYAYGRHFSAATTSVSHISAHELPLATALTGEGERVLLVSDPVTLANLKALTGLNSILSFSNLDTLRAETESQLRRWLADIVGDEHRPGQDQDPRQCTSQPSLWVTGSDIRAAEFYYWVRRMQKPDWTGAKVLRWFEYSPALLLTPSASARPGTPRDAGLAWLPEAFAQLRGRVSVLLVVNSRTLLWTRAPQTHLAYFPGLEPLPQWLRDSLRSRCNAQIWSEHFALVRFPL